MSHLGRRCALEGVEEVTALEYGMDFRLPQYRREVFHRFYQFHLRYRSHPGGVYYLMPYLAQRHGWTKEEQLWYAFLNGNTQHPVTSWIIFREFPSVHHLDGLKFEAWLQRTVARLPFDTDRRYFRTKLSAAVQHYRQQLGGVSQWDYLNHLCGHGTAQERFMQLWNAQGKFLYFGRLSMFSYMEYLKLMGLHLDCGNLFLYDIQGSRSHRNGLCKVLGRDDLDWHVSNPEFPGYTKEILAWLEQEAAVLLAEAQRRNALAPPDDISYFTMESALCTYKSWHRPNRRYPNVYNDMLALRILDVERKWGERFTDFWAARQTYLPEHLRLEDNPADGGLHSEKQNHYLLTGEPVMMQRDWPCFRNAYNDRVEAQQATVAAS